MELSASKSIDLSSIRIHPKRAELSTRVLALDVGQGFEAHDIEHEQMVYAREIARSAGRKVSLRKMGKHHYLIARVA